jgi:putative sterol carrier protein
MNQEIHEIKSLIERINQEHISYLEGLNSKVLLEIHLKDGSSVFVEISKHGLKTVKPDLKKTIQNQVILSFKDLKKLIDNPSNIIRFLTTGRVKVKGNIREIFEILENL